ncbi:hypothetical protein BO79DRAFT_18784 [Aspergillus costaricaensis CBS 115574]|uniref:Uncharacterized protein n=1 Tax=Aspergillus costaricaensis CBS 115574 TaxID=1448317 RepID=A0ACD1IE74_9EURO|nr:hypothetical protein BO79DRAFT_18784 [Aspergillus costaricaensis CBS 115574]RAK88312.1 hypothetical protein BO79DRAFT_18784 [Aspergillus costaricaensis CBS 115574]
MVLFFSVQKKPWSHFGLLNIRRIQSMASLGILIECCIRNAAIAARHFHVPFPFQCFLFLLFLTFSMPGPISPDRSIRGRWANILFHSCVFFRQCWVDRDAPHPPHQKGPTPRNSGASRSTQERWANFFSLSCLFRQRW